MAKVRITLEDTPEGSISVQMKFSPELKVKDKPTPAQGLAARILHIISGTEEDEDDVH